MKRNPEILLVSVLAISPGTLSFPEMAWAIPDNQSSLIVTTELTRDNRASKPAAVSEENTGTDNNPERHDRTSYDSHICPQDPGGITPVQDKSENKSCVDPSDAQQRFSVQLGRSIGTSGDILGKSNGVRVGYRLSDKLKLNGIAGYPVLAARDTFNSDRQVFGISVETKPVGRKWDLNGYLIEQRENGQTNGESMGGVISHLQSKRSLLVYLDYDVTSNKVGTLMASGAWKLPFKTTISAALDRSNRPIPGNQQKYLQQSMTVMKGWDWILPTNRQAHYTGDGCCDVSTLAFGLSHELSQRIRLSGDVAVLGTTDDVDTATETTFRSSEYSYHMKLSGKDLLLPGDRNMLDLRYSVTEADRTSGASLDTKYAINRFWNIRPKLRADYHRPVLENSPRWITSPTVKMEYQKSKQSGFNLEAGGKWVSGVNATADDSRSFYFVSLGYEAKF